LRSNFYFTGGTALSYLYLQHRHSEDLDFFSTNKLDKEKILSFVRQLAKEVGFTFEAQMKEVVYIFLLKFENGVSLKVDFGYYPYQRVEKGIEYKHLEVDSLLDIAINKLISVNQRLASKDFVDLYFLLKHFTLWDLIYGAEKKFRMELDPFILSSDLLDRVEQLDTLPRMIKPLTLKELRAFFTEKSKEAAKRMVE
jgi:predicted nucleotidyltransferase component of viral defense system